MFTIGIAGLKVGIDNRYEYVEKQCADYRVRGEADLVVKATEEDIAREVAHSTEEVRTTVKDLRGYSESVCIYRNLAYRLPEYDALLLHGAAVARGDEAYIFSAPSGTGKSTHLRLWVKAHGDELQVINGDKPILRRQEDGKFKVYGTPWSGKEGWENDVSATLAGLCFLRRGKKNEIARIELREAAERIFKQIVFPRDTAALTKMLQLLDAVIRSCPVYLLACDISPEAAELSYRTMTENKA